MNLRILLLSVGLTLMAHAGAASMGYSYEDGKGLLSLCQGDSNFKWGACHSYLVAIHDAHGSFTHSGLLREKHFCPPDGVTVGQLKEAFVNYANDRPEKLHLTASSLVIDAFNNAFPCQ